MEQEEYTESEAEYLVRLGEEYLFFKNKILPGSSDEAFEYQKDLAGKRPMGVGSFLADFAISGEERRRNLERWTEGKKLPEPTREQTEAVRTFLPSFVVVNPEALGSMKVEPTQKYKIDLAVDDILSEIAKLLPRRIDTYQFHQDYAEDTLEVPEIGIINVKLYKTGDGIFTTIGNVESDLFRISNQRLSGVKYLDRYNDISRPGEIELRPKGIQIELYDDDLGIFVGKDGKRFTNSRWRTAKESGYSGDSYRDELYRTYSGLNPNAPPKPGYTNEGWRDDKTVLSWQKIEDEAIIWLAKNVLTPLQKAPKPEHQTIMPPEEEPFPTGKVGPLFTFVEMKDISRIVRIKDNPEKAYPDERKAVKASKRLLPLNISRGNDIPEAAYDGYIWCGIGEINEDTNMDQITIGSEERKSDRLFGSNEGIAAIKPKTATDIYVIDWKKWDDFRKKTFSPTHTRLTDVEYNELHRVVARTMIPVTKYDGSYKHPLVLIGRDLDLDEVQTVFVPPESKSGLQGINIISEE